MVQRSKRLGVIGRLTAIGILAVAPIVGFLSEAPPAGAAVRSGLAIVLLPPDPCSVAANQSAGCIDVIPRLLQVDTAGNGIPVSGPLVLAIGSEQVWLLPPGPCSVGSANSCTDLVPGLIQIRTVTNQGA
jgi:hypothetical protein